MSTAVPVMSVIWIRSVLRNSIRKIDRILLLADTDVDVKVTNLQVVSVSVFVRIPHVAFTDAVLWYWTLDDGKCAILCTFCVSNFSFLHNQLLLSNNNFILYLILILNSRWASFVEQRIH